MQPPPETTQGTLLAGRIRYAQPRRGWRTGIEPVFLAAAIPARPGERVLEAGTGAGAGLLCLATRIPGLHGIGIEQDPDMAALARRNLAANGLTFEILEADIAARPATGSVHHAFANPPWHDPAATHPPHPGRAAATHRSPAGLVPWITFLASSLAPAGTLTLILPATMVDPVASLLTATGLAHIVHCPLWPRQDRPPKIVIVQARTTPGPRSLPLGLVLHEADGRYTPQADAILRDAAALHA